MSQIYRAKTSQLTYTVLKQFFIIGYKTNLQDAVKEPMATIVSILTSMFSLNSVGKGHKETKKSVLESYRYCMFLWRYYSNSNVTLLLKYPSQLSSSRPTKCWTQYSEF